MFEFYNLCELKYASLNICCFSKNCTFVKQVRSLHENERLLDCVTSHLRPVVKSHGSESQNKHTMSTRMTDELCRCCFVSTFLFSVLKRPAPLSPRGVSNETTCFSDHLCTRLLTWNDQLRVSPRPRGAAEQIWRGKKGREKRSGWFDVPQEDERKKNNGVANLTASETHTGSETHHAPSPLSSEFRQRVLIRRYTQPETQPKNVFFNLRSNQIRSLSRDIIRKGNT